MSLTNTSNTPETNALKSEVEKILAEVPDFVDENKTLKINIIKDYAERGVVKLLEPLLKNRQTKRAFFKPVLDSFVFNSVQFKEFLEYSSACNSYSKYLGQKIGLYMGDSSLLDRNEVVLNFPFKDCVLEGGQKKEDGLDSYFEYDEKKNEYAEKQSKRREIFYNEVLARDEIDSLFSPKAFCNAKRYEKGKSGAVEPVETIKLNRNAELNKKRGLPEDTITDNLIIKGNNLLALHSLKKEFAGKVKLIYIDPPYNTGNDGFAYNDNFNHSSWLTFMKNRLEIARELLREDGCIFVQCSFHQFAYLRVLMDGIFKRHLCDFNIQVRHPDRALTGDKEFNDVIEYILIYAKNENVKMPHKEEIKTIDDYTLEIEISKNAVPEKITCGNKIVEVYKPSDYKVIIVQPNRNGLKKMSIRGSIREKNSSGRFFVKYLEPLSQYSPETLFKVPDMGDDAQGFRYFYSAPEGKKNGGYYQGMPTSSDITRKQFANFYNFEKEYNTVAHQGNITFRNGKKPEQLLKFLIETFTLESDIILDYHLGSGTTAAVAHKMNRQYIGIEQLDYGENDSVVRLQNVINGDQTGISKTVDWQGGGSFVYLELAKKNEKALEQISDCKSLEELVKLFDELCTKYFLHYNVRIKEFRKEIETEHFKSLPLEKQKEMFSRLLDLNQLYVNADDRHDKTTGLTKNDITITEDFYQLKKDGE